MQNCSFKRVNWDKEMFCCYVTIPERRYPALLLESSLTPHSEEKTGVYTYWISLALSKPLNIWKTKTCTWRREWRGSGFKKKRDVQSWSDINWIESTCGSNVSMNNDGTRTASSDMKLCPKCTFWMLSRYSYQEQLLILLSIRLYGGSMRSSGGAHSHKFGISVCVWMLSSMDIFLGVATAC